MDVDVEGASNSKTEHAPTAAADGGHRSEREYVRTEMHIEITTASVV